MFFKQKNGKHCPLLCYPNYINELIRLLLFPPVPLLQDLRQLLRHECCQRGLERLHLCVELSCLSEEAVPGLPSPCPVETTAQMAPCCTLCTLTD